MKKQITIKLLNMIGIMLVLFVMILALPLSVPKLFGMKVYGVVSGSMEPEYGVGGVVYVKACDVRTLQEGDVITYLLGTDTDYVMTHRIVKIQEDGSFVTKGDANSATDPEPVESGRIIGRVEGYLPYLASPAEYMTKPQGVAGLCLIFVLALICWMLADIVKNKQSNGTEHQKKQPVAQTEKKAAPKAFSLIQVTGVLIMLGAGIYMGYTFLEYRKGESEYEQLKEQVFHAITSENGFVEAGSGSQETEGVTEGGEIAERHNEDKDMQAAILQLQEQNKDTIGWLSFESLGISYPLMQGDDNEYYLKHTFSGEVNSAGSIFMEVLNHKDMQDAHTIIYGHNMKNRSMFGNLRELKQKEKYAENSCFFVYTEEKIYAYQIFACYDVSEYSDVYTIWYTPDENFENRLKLMQQKAYYDTEVEVTAEDKVLTLSTCSAEGSRFVVHAKMIWEKEY